MRKLIAGTIAALATSTALLAGGTSAEAAPATTAHQQVASDKSSQAWQYYDWYWTYASCDYKGRSLIQRGYARAFYCEENWAANFDLYIQR